MHKSLMRTTGESPRAAEVYLAFGKATSARDAVDAQQFWQSLPQASKLLISLIVLQTCLWVVNVATAAHPSKTCIGRPGCSVEHWEVSITTLLAQLSYAYMALDAIHEENAFQLVTSTGLGVLAALLWVLFAAILQLPSLAWSLGLTLGFAGLTAVNAWLTYLTYQQFGWRVHSKLACDLRRKHAAEKRHLYFANNRFKTLLRLSCHTVLINAANGLIMALATKHAAASTTAAGLQVSGAALMANSSNPAVKGLLISVGLYALPLAWLTITYLAVRYNSSSLELASTISMPPLLALPALPIYWVFSPTYLWPEHVAARVLLVAVPLAAWMVLHIATWCSMRQVLQHFRSPHILELVAAAVEDVADLNHSVPEQLQPMLKGAWLLKAQHCSDSSCQSGNFKVSKKSQCFSNAAVSDSAWVVPSAEESDDHTAQDAGSCLQAYLNSISRGWQAVMSAACCSSKRWRFFQLSADLTTLRWAWNKYILLYFVESLTVDADRLTITLHMMLDPDLSLVFEDPRLFDEWESALQLLLHMVTGTAPGSFQSGTCPAGQIKCHTPDDVGTQSCSNGSIPTAFDHEMAYSSRVPAGCVDASFVSQHSLVMNALQVQHGFAKAGRKHGSTALFDWRSAGEACVAVPKKRRVSGRSFLQGSRRSSVNDPHAVRLSQAQAVVDIVSRQLSISPVPHTSVATSTPRRPQQLQQHLQREPAKDMSPKRMQPEHIAWLQQQHSSDSAQPSHSAYSSCVNPLFAASAAHGGVIHLGKAADALTLQLHLPPHHLSTHPQQQQQWQPPNGATRQPLTRLHERQQPVATAHTVELSGQQVRGRVPRGDGANFGPFRTPEGLLKQLNTGEHQQRNRWQHLSTSSEEGSAVAGVKSSDTALVSSNSVSHASTTSDHQQCHRHEGTPDNNNPCLGGPPAAMTGGDAAAPAMNAISSYPLQLSMEPVKRAQLPIMQQCELPLVHTVPDRSGYTSPCSSPEPGAGSKLTLLKRANIPLGYCTAASAANNAQVSSTQSSWQDHDNIHMGCCVSEGVQCQQQRNLPLPPQWHGQQYSQPPTPNVFGVYTSAALTRRAQSPIAAGEAAGAYMPRSSSMPAVLNSWSEPGWIVTCQPRCQHHSLDTANASVHLTDVAPAARHATLVAAGLQHSKTWKFSSSNRFMGGSLQPSKEFIRPAEGPFVLPVADRATQGDVIPAVWDHAIQQAISPAAEAAALPSQRCWPDWMEQQAVPGGDVLQSTVEHAELLSNRASAGGSVQQLESPGRSQCTCEPSGASPAAKLAPCQASMGSGPSNIGPSTSLDVSNAATGSMELPVEQLAHRTMQQVMEPMQLQCGDKASSCAPCSVHLHRGVDSWPSSCTATLQAPAGSTGGTEIQGNSVEEGYTQYSRIDAELSQRIMQLTPPHSLPCSACPPGSNTAAAATQNSFPGTSQHHSECQIYRGQAYLPQQQFTDKQTPLAAVQSRSRANLGPIFQSGLAEKFASSEQQMPGRLPSPANSSLSPLSVLPKAASAELESGDAMNLPDEQQQQSHHTCCVLHASASRPQSATDTPQKQTGAHLAAAHVDNLGAGSHSHQIRVDELSRCSIRSFTFNAQQEQQQQQQQPLSQGEQLQPFTLQAAYQLAKRDRFELQMSSTPVEQPWNPWTGPTKPPVSPRHCTSHPPNPGTSFSKSPKIGSARPAAPRVSISDAADMTTNSHYPVEQSAGINARSRATPPTGAALMSCVSLDSPKGIARLQVRVPAASRGAQGPGAVGWPFTQYPPYQGSLGLAQHVPPHYQQLVSSHMPHADESCVVNTPGSLASFSSHMSVFTDMSPRAARTQMYSMASGGYGGSLQFNSSINMSNNWTACSGGSRWSCSTARKGMSPQVSVELIEWRYLQLGRKIGRGAEGCVYEARYQDAPVAVKETPGMHEIEMYLAVGVHDNLVGLRGLTQKEDGTWCLLLEYCGRGTLDTLLHHSRSPLPRAAHHVNNGSNHSSSSCGKTGPTAAQGVKAAESATGQQQQQDRQDLVKLLPLMRGIARGLLHLHTRRPAILHRDIKPANIFIGHGMVMKIGDFGMSRPVHQTYTASGVATASAVSRSGSSAAARDDSESGGNKHSAGGARKNSRNGGVAAGGQHHGIQQAASKVPNRTLTPGVVGTIAYSAPEVLDEQYQAPDANTERILKADVYSLGVTIWEMIERRRPFEGMDGMQICALWIADPERMTLPPLTVGSNASETDKQVLGALQELVSDCTAFHPSARPTMGQVLGRIRHIQRLYDPRLAVSDAGGISKGGVKQQLGGHEGKDALPAVGNSTCSTTAAVQLPDEQQEHGVKSAVDESYAVVCDRQHGKGLPGVTDPAVAAAIAAAAEHAALANEATQQSRVTAPSKIQGTQQQEGVVGSRELAPVASDGSAGGRNRSSKSDSGGCVGSRSKVHLIEECSNGLSVLVHSSSMPNVPCTVLPAVQHMSSRTDRRVSGAGLHHRHVR